MLNEEHCQYVKAGGSPRAFLKLISAVLAESFCMGDFLEQGVVSNEVIIRVVDNIMRHRIHMDVHARLAGVTPEDVVHKVCEIILS